LEALAFRLPLPFTAAWCFCNRIASRLLLLWIPLRFNDDNKVQLIEIKPVGRFDNLQSRTYSFQWRIGGREKEEASKRKSIRTVGGGGGRERNVLVTHITTCSCCTGKKLTESAKRGYLCALQNILFNLLWSCANFLWIPMSNLA